MNDPSGVPSALGIERVEWFAEGGDRLTVRVTGRWRRRRPPSSGQPLLVVEAHGVRHRFPAMPEPPSVTGTVPGTWRMTFSVPASLAPYLAQRIHLQLGAMTIPLPVAVEAAEGVRTVVQHEQRRLAESEATATQLRVRIEQLEDELEQARDSLAELERARRAAEQRAHAERSLRLELDEQLASALGQHERSRDALGELAVVEERIRELEEQLEHSRRRADEAEHLAAAARAERDRARMHAIRPQLRGEVGLVKQLAPAPVRGARALALTAERTPLLEAERVIVARRQGDATRLEETLAALRAELNDLRTLASRSAQAYAALEQVRLQIASMRAQPAVAPHELPAASPQYREATITMIEPDRLAAAQARLRETTLQQGQLTLRGRWLWLAFRRLLERDPLRAGELLLGLLPAQSLVYSDWLAYDLIITGQGSVRVRVAPQSGVAVEVSDVPRDPLEVRFQVKGSLVGIARRLAAGPIRRAFPVGLARVRGDRWAVRFVKALLREPLTPHDLYEAGVRLDPVLTLTLVSAMIDPHWTRGEQFTLAHHLSDPPGQLTYLHVLDGRRPVVSAHAPDGPVTTTVTCSSDLLLPVLAGQRPADAYISGDERPLALVQHWLELAQSA